MTPGLVDSLIYRFFLRLVLGFSSLIHRLRALLDRLLPLDLDQGNRTGLNLDQTFEVVSQGLHQRLKLVLDRSAIACPLVQPGKDALKWHSYRTEPAVFIKVFPFHVVLQN